MNERVKILIGEVQHLDKNIRAEAALGLGKTHDPAATVVLLQALRSETDPFVQENLTWAIVRMGPSAIEPLLEMLHDPDPAVRHHVVHTLGKIKDPHTLSALVDMLQDADMVVKSKAVFALGQLGDRAAIPALVACLGQGDRLFQETLNTVLENFGEPALAVLIQALAHAHGPVREQAADILEMMDDPAAIQPLRQLLIFKIIENLAGFIREAQSK